MPHKDFTRTLLYAIGLQVVVATTAETADAPNTPNASWKQAQGIAWDQVSAKAGADYHGGGLLVAATEADARFHCAFQRLDGEATSEGLWLVSTVTNGLGERFRVVARAVGRQGAAGTSNIQHPTSNIQLSPVGKVSVAGQTVRLTRAGLVEEYSVGLDGVRQDFLVTEKPAGDGPLKLQLAVSEARVEAATHGAQLVLEKSGRKIAYSRLHATDANGQELAARIEAEPNSALRSSPSASGMAVVVNDAGAVYPVRIDPTFSDANWISMNPRITGTDGYVNAAVVDGAGNLYIGGSFTVVGNAMANNIAKWNGSSWSALGSGMTNPVYALAVSGGTLYAGGDFTMAGGNAANSIAQWNGSSWSALGSGMTNTVYALAVSNGTLYAGGDFTTAGGNAANSIAQWNGTNWSALGSGMNGGVRALAMSGGTLYAGGRFTTAGGNAANSIAQWNGSSWSALGSGMTNPVYALAVSGGTLYAGGDFDGTNSVVQWNGNTWLPVGSGMNGAVWALAVSGGTLYAGGQFTTAGTNAANYVAQWNGSSWSPLQPFAAGPVGSGMNDAVRALAVRGAPEASGGTLYAGGWFTTAGGIAANYIAKWNGGWYGGNWSALPPPRMSGAVWALAVSGDKLYAGGWFTTAGGDVTNSIAQWNGSSWAELGTGMNGTVTSLAVSGGTLYAGGSFTAAGGNAANYIAQWNGSSWSPLGSGMNNGVRALAVSGGTLYAGGYFTTAGGNPANSIAQWDGTNWSALGSGLVGSVYTLAVLGGKLYAGGTLQVPYSSGDFIEEWDGSTWSTAGGFASPVFALAASDGTLYASGVKYETGWQESIGQWNGGGWSYVGVFDRDVHALAASGGMLYAGGYFTTAGGQAANFIARWDGTNWSALGSGVGGTSYTHVNAMVVSGDTLYVGGDFMMAGGKVSAYVAQAVLVSPEIQKGPVPNNDGSMTLQCSTAANRSSRLHTATNLTLPVVWRPLYTNLTGGVWQFTDTNASGNHAEFYRLSTP